MYTLSIDQIYHILQENQLLIEPAPKSLETAFNYLSYDSRNIDAQTLFFCKGENFQTSSLANAVQKGVAFYISETLYDSPATGIIVTDIQKAMALIAQAFYQNPQEHLFIIGITGTKGKTTTAYFIKSILDQAYPQKIALFSSEETCLDGATLKASSLTTPEALEIYRQMAQAVRNGLTHLVMEVSSQAYKKQRVFGLTFDIGIFLNISPDHISPLEHESFEDYFACKQQLLFNSRKVILHQEIFEGDAPALAVPVYTYGRHSSDLQVQRLADPRTFQLATNHFPALQGNYSLAFFGAFNHENATAAILASQLAGATLPAIQRGLAKTHVPGRMNLLEKKNGAYIFIDYAHNYLSIKAIGDFAKSLRPTGKTIFVTGSAGGKAFSRRPDIGRALSECADTVILTSDDPDFECPQAIAKEIQQAITNPAVFCHFNEDRKQAVKQAIDLAQANDTVILAGKGMENWLKVKGEKIPYESDFHWAQQIIESAH